jgi:hypothetical protein
MVAATRRGARRRPARRLDEEAILSHLDPDLRRLVEVVAEIELARLERGRAADNRSSGGEVTAGSL